MTAYIKFGGEPVYGDQAIAAILGRQGLAAWVGMAEENDPSTGLPYIPNPTVPSMVEFLEARGMEAGALAGEQAAAPYAGQAQASALDAAGSEQVAGQYATIAEQAGTAAASYAQALAAAGPVYPSVAAGLAANPTNGAVWKATPGPGYAIGIYETVAGVAVIRALFPDAQALEAVRAIFVTEDILARSFMLVDAKGRVGLMFDDMGDGWGARIDNAHYNYLSKGGPLAGSVQPDDYRVLFVDGNGIAGAMFDNIGDGRGPRLVNAHYDKMADATDALERSVQKEELTVKFTDAKDVAAAIMEADGTWRFPSLDRAQARATEALARSRRLSRNPALRKYMLLAGICHILIYGQSLSIDTSSNPVYRDNPVHPSALMFKGLRSREGDADATWRATLNPLADKAFQDGSIYYGGGMTTSAVDMIVNLMASEDGIDLSDYAQKLLLSAPGEGAKSVADLSNGGSYFERLKADITAGAARAAELSLPYLLQAMVWVQGERDTEIATNPATYKAAVLQLIADVRAHHLSVTGVDWTFPLITTQLANFRAYSRGPEIAEALLQLAQENDDIFLSTPLYPFVTVADQKHLTGISSNLAGAYNGIALKRLLIDGETPPVLTADMPIWMPNRIVLPANPPSGRLVQDTVNVADPGALGFGLLDHAGSPVTISAAEVLPSNLVRIDYAGAALQAGAKLTYAHGTDAMNGELLCTGPVYGPRGCIRDTQGDTLTAFGRALHNWLPIQHWTR